ncbi:MAG: uracil-DNA glycosylase [Candidatus Kapaibacterium sp.]
MPTIADELKRYVQQHVQMHGRVVYADAVDPSSIIMAEANETALPDEVHSEAVHVDVIGNSNQPVVHEEMMTATTLDAFHAQINTCMKCPLGDTRTNFVFGSGNPNADIMVIGEAPGADEDAQGLPFVGRAGQLLTKILESIDLQRDDVYICNILKCRPPNNRKPLAGETDSCEPYLWKQIELIKPKFILALGLTAAHTLLKSSETMSALRGTIHDYQGIKTLVTYHPAALLRNPEWKKLVWEDVKFLRSLYLEAKSS